MEVNEHKTATYLTELGLKIAARCQIIPQLWALLPVSVGTRTGSPRTSKTPCSSSDDTDVVQSGWWHFHVLRRRSAVTSQPPVRPLPPSLTWCRARPWPCTTSSLTSVLSGALWHLLPGGDMTSGAQLPGSVDLKSEEPTEPKQRSGSEEHPVHLRYNM